jgi:hypothetical protein
LRGRSSVGSTKTPITITAIDARFVGALLDDAESESVRLRAAVSLLDILDAAELRELSGRLEQLERSLSPNGGQG